MDSSATQKAAITESPGPDSKIVIKDIPIPTPEDDEILVKLNWSGLCHSDVHLMRDDWGDRGLTMKVKIAGHEGAGTVMAVGKNVRRFNVGDRAGIKWVTSICGDCEMCTNGTDELHCPKQRNSGFTVNGTFQQYATTSARYATKIPAGVLDEEAGPVSPLLYFRISILPPMRTNVSVDYVRWSDRLYSSQTVCCLSRAVGRPSRSRRRTRPLCRPIRKSNGYANHRHRWRC